MKPSKTENQMKATRTAGIRGRKVSSRTFRIALDLFRSPDSYSVIGDRHGVQKQVAHAIAVKMTEAGWMLPTRRNAEN